MTDAFILDEYWVMASVPGHSDYRDYRDEHLPVPSRQERRAKNRVNVDSSVPLHGEEAIRNWLLQRVTVNDRQRIVIGQMKIHTLTAYADAVHTNPEFVQLIPVMIDLAYSALDITSVAVCYDSSMVKGNSRGDLMKVLDNIRWSYNSLDALVKDCNLTRPVIQEKLRALVRVNDAVDSIGKPVLEVGVSELVITDTRYGVDAIISAIKKHGFSDAARIIHILEGSHVALADGAL